MATKLSGRKAQSVMVIKDLADLAPGCHICLPKDRGDYPQNRHMVVMEVDRPRMRVNVIHYHSGCRSKDPRKPDDTVIETWEPVDPEEDGVQRYDYEEEDIYPAAQVLLNARHCLGKGPDGLAGVIPPRVLRPMLSASRRFAEWCLTGKGWKFVPVPSDNEQ